MSNFFKNLGKGVLYVFLFPFIIAGIALAGVIGIFIFIYQLIKTIILFFTGRTVFSPLEEDIKAQAIMNANNEEENEEEKENTNNQYQNDYQVYTTGNFNNTAPEGEDNDDETDEEDSDLWLI